MNRCAQSLRETAHRLCIALLCVILSAGQVFAGSMTLLGAGGKAASVTYQGPGDVVASASTWASCSRVYTAAQASTSTLLCDINAVTGGAAVCTLRGSSTGYVDLAASYCAGTTPAAACAAASGGSCVVSKMYDQTGNGLHFIQGTSANMVPLSFNVLNGLPGLSPNNVGAKLLATAALVSAINQPLTYTTVAERSGNFTTGGRIIYPNSGTPRFSYGTVTNQVLINAGSALNVTASDSAFHAMVAVANNASSLISVDGSVTSGTIGATGIAIGQTILLTSDGTTQMTGFMMEAGVWPIAFNSTQYGNMNTNLHSATSGYNF